MNLCCPVFYLVKLYLEAAKTADKGRERGGPSWETFFFPIPRIWNSSRRRQPVVGTAALFQIYVPALLTETGIKLHSLSKRWSRMVRKSHWW